MWKSYVIFAFPLAAVLSLICRRHRISSFPTQLKPTSFSFSTIWWLLLLIKQQLLNFPSFSTFRFCIFLIFKLFYLFNYHRSDYRRSFFYFLLAAKKTCTLFLLQLSCALMISCINFNEFYLSLSLCWLSNNEQMLKMHETCSWFIRVLKNCFIIWISHCKLIFSRWENLWKNEKIYNNSGVVWLWRGNLMGKLFFCVHRIAIMICNLKLFMRREKEWYFFVLLVEH